MPQLCGAKERKTAGSAVAGGAATHRALHGYKLLGRFRDVGNTAYCKRYAGKCKPHDV
jgi:hypothetical protein